jgi:hypothetical protein
MPRALAKRRFGRGRPGQAAFHCGKGMPNCGHGSRCQTKRFCLQRPRTMAGRRKIWRSSTLSNWTAVRPIPRQPDLISKLFPFEGNIGVRKLLVSLSMIVRGLIKWRWFHQFSIWRAFFLPAFWLATSSGRLFQPDVGGEPAGASAAMILKDRNDPTTSPLRDFPVALTMRLLRNTPPPGRARADRRGQDRSDSRSRERTSFEGDRKLDVRHVQQ